MLEMIEERKGSATLEERQDLFSNLIRASMEKTVPQKDVDFTDRELLGNIWFFLMAGKPCRFRVSSIELWSRS